jgi:hypothetical protein
MGVFEKNFVVGIFKVWIFGLLQLLSLVWPCGTAPALARCRAANRRVP